MKGAPQVRLFVSARKPLRPAPARPSSSLYSGAGRLAPLALGRHPSERNGRAVLSRVYLVSPRLQQTEVDTYLPPRQASARRKGSPSEARALLWFKAEASNTEDHLRSVRPLRRSPRRTYGRSSAFNLLDTAADRQLPRKPPSPTGRRRRARTPLSNDSTRASAADTPALEAAASCSGTRTAAER